MQIRLSLENKTRRPAATLFVSLGMAIANSLPPALAAPGSAGVINSQGKEIVPCEHGGIKYVGGGFFYAVDAPNVPFHPIYTGKLYDRDGREVPVPLPSDCTLSGAYWVDDADHKQSTSKHRCFLVVQLHGPDGFGLCRIDGSVILKAKYTGIAQTSDRCFLIWHDKDCQPPSILDASTGKKKQLPDGVSTINFKLGTLHPIQQRGKGWGYTSDDGTMQIAPQFFSASTFSPDGLAIVQVRTEPSKTVPKDAFINDKGEIVSPYYDHAEPFLNGFAVIWQHEPNYTTTKKLIDKHFHFSITDCNDIKQIYPDAYAIQKTVNSPYQAVTPQGKVLFDFPADVTYIQPASDGLVLCTSARTYQAGSQPAHERTLSYFDRSGKLVLTVDGLRALPMQFGFGCIAKFRPGHPVQWQVINKRGAVLQPPQDAYFAPLCEDRILKLKQSDRFDPVYWRAALYRYGEFATFLRNYDLIAMSKDQVIALLGQPQRNDYYSLASGTCGNTWSGFEIEYESDRVKRWREVGRSGGVDYSGSWVTTNVIYGDENEDIGRLSGKPYITTLYPKTPADFSQRSLREN